MEPVGFCIFGIINKFSGLPSAIFQTEKICETLTSTDIGIKRGLCQE